MSTKTTKNNKLHLNAFFGLLTKTYSDETNVMKNKDDILAANQMIFLKIKDSSFELALQRYLVEIHSEEMKELIKEKDERRKANGQNSELQIEENLSIELGKPSDYIHILIAFLDGISMFAF